ncbi:tautomerase family protein [Lacticaseibacillus thailandensis]|uniref:Uncharacterized protein n=2 Tax=Lacticaseibacillus thailandensis TaxID=381741 RepID=A0A0R2CIA7_9LACO|nr:tautomerase family protein [Lacticaseibacillus thailandensis]KRM87427.1 hypothetical protein FD19_GL000931 [Lacticaseibacillus thailandensis DSM 22698 = JCM 13996]
MVTQLAVNTLGKNAAAAVADVQFRDPHTWFVGGQSMAAAHQTGFYVEIKVTAGTNTRDQEAAFIRQSFAHMQDIFGDVAETSYVVVHTVDSADWGYGGRTQEDRYVQG